MPRTLLPNASRRGEYVQTPSTFGTTSINPPATPLFAGTPIENANSPEKSYIPHEYMSERQARTVDDRSTRSPEIGHTPPFASVAATTAMRSQLVSIEQHW